MTPPFSRPWGFAGMMRSWSTARRGWDGVSYVTEGAILWARPSEDDAWSTSRLGR